MTQRASLARDARGTVMVETLFAFMPLFLIFLGVIQYALLAVAQLVVQHAAVAGVRAAVVVLEDDPAEYEGTELRIIAGSARPAASDILSTLFKNATPSEIKPFAAPLPGIGPQLQQMLMQRDSPRMSAIRQAVHARLATIVPARGIATLFGLPGLSVRDAFGDTPALRIAQAPFYLPVTTAVTFPTAPGSDELFVERVDAGKLVTLRVTHIALCTIPIVDRIMCHELSSFGWADLFGWGADAQAKVELRHAPAAPFQNLFKVSGARVRVLRAEASLPAQDAPYQYKSQREGGAS
jgi:hypothetical protein